MDSEIQLPLSLVREMNDDVSLNSLRSFGASASEGTLGGALRGHALWDKQRATFVRRLETRELQRIVDEFKHRNQADTFWSSFTAADCSWELVTDQLHEIESEYAHGHVVRRALRSGRVENLRPLVEGIPDENGLGFLKAGIVILLDTVKRRSQACKNILDCFRDIPQLLLRVEHTLERFSKDEDHEIYGCATRLYSAMVDNLPPLIDHLLRQSDQSKIKRVGNMMKSVVVDEIATVDEYLQPIITARTALVQRESRISEARYDKVATQVGETRGEAKMIRQNQHQHHNATTTRLTNIDFTTGRMYQQGSRIESKLDAITDVVDARNAHVQIMHLSEQNAALKESVEQLRVHASLRDEIAELRAFKNEVRSAFHLIAQEKTRNQRYLQEDPRQQQHSNINTTSLPPFHPVQNLDELIQIICSQTESTYHVTDLYSTLQQYDTFSERALAQAAYLSEKPQFRTWLQEQGPGSLLVDGHCSEHKSRSTSPLSVFCATLDQSLLSISQTSSDMILYFFCGHHLSPDGPLYGPQGLIRSLTTQVILELRCRQVHPHLEFLTELPYLQEYTRPEDIDIRAMCSVFTGLLNQFPAGTIVYCVLDGISQFETVLGGMREDLRIVVACLQWCVVDVGASVFMKLLLSSADASTVVRQQIPRREHVDLISGHFYGSLMSPPALMRDLSNKLSFSVSGYDQAHDRNS